MATYNLLIIIFKEHFIKNALSWTSVKLTTSKKKSSLHPLLGFQGQSSHFSMVSGLSSSTASEHVPQKVWECGRRTQNRHCRIFKAWRSPQSWLRPTAQGSLLEQGHCSSMTTHQATDLNHYTFCSVFTWFAPNSWMMLNGGSTQSPRDNTSKTYCLLNQIFIRTLLGSLTVK